jgi:hypothetical protein
VTLAGWTPAADTRFRVPNADRLHGFREPEVQHLDVAVGSELDVGRFQIAMNDPVDTASFLLTLRDSI